MANNGTIYIIEDNLEFLKFMEDLQAQYLAAKDEGVQENVKK